MTIEKALANEIVDPYAYADWDRAHAAYAKIRASTPFDIAEPDGYDPFWVVSKFSDIQAIERQGTVFLSGSPDTLAILQSTASRKATEELEARGGTSNSGRSIVSMDDPEHLKHRMVTQAAFMPRNLKPLEDKIRSVAREFVDLMLSFGGECDFAEQVAFLYPLRVVMEVLGVPREDELTMLRLTQESFGAQDPEMNRAKAEMTPEEHVKQKEEISLQYIDYFSRMAEDRRTNPREDLATVIANATIDGEPMGPEETIAYFRVVSTAGHDTTSSTTAGAAWVLAEHPEMFNQLKSEMSLIPGFVEESIRWETPVKHFVREAAEDVEFAGKKISKGDALMLCYQSGNRDESMIDRPFEFDMTREANKHVAFGFGPHVCLGQHLARLEMRLFWEELLPRLNSIELNGEPARLISNFICGPKRLPIRFS